MKTIFISLILIFSFNYEIFSQSDDTVYCHLVEYGFDNYDYYNVIVPLKRGTVVYELITKNPLSAYLFIETMNEAKIRQLTVRQLKTMTFSGYSTDKYIPIQAFAYSLYLIEGFETYCKELETIDEFDLAERKEEFLNKLVECWHAYNSEFLDLAAKTLKMGIGFENKTEIENEYHSLGYTYLKNHSSKKFYNGDGYQVTKDNYDFDNQVMTFPFPLLVASHSRGNVWGWNRIISSNLTEEIRINAKNRSYKDHIEPELAKRLIKSDVGGLSEMILKLDNGFKNYFGNGGTTYLQKFNIEQIIFYYYAQSEYSPMYTKTFYN